MNEYPTLYRVLRDGRTWDETVALSNLTAADDGALQLQGLPALAAGGAIRLPAPYATAWSGVACGKGGTTYIAITSANGQIRMAECGCGDQIVAQDNFAFPRGLLVMGNQLLVADSGNARVLVLNLPSLVKRGEWTEGLKDPLCLAADSAKRVYVLDTGSRRALRFSPAGEIDPGFNVVVADPASIAIDARNRLYVTDLDTLLFFDSDGAHGVIAPPPPPSLPAPPFKPRALAARGHRLYVADAESGYIQAYDTSTQTWLGPVSAYRGPVSAMAIDENGALLVKPGQDEVVYSFAADAARVLSGTLTVGPLDAGEGAVWERAWAEAELSAETSLSLDVAMSNDSGTSAGSLVWKRSPSLDVLIRTLGDINAARFLWLRVTLESSDGRSTPKLLQVQASTVQPGYLDHLPAIYRRDDAATGFLERWLALFRSELGDWDRALEELPRQFDARTVSEDRLGKLAAWVAMELPARMAVPEQRRLLSDAQALYRRRGTPAGLREMVKRYLGVTIHLFEAFRERRVWQLGEGQGLGLDTALAAGTPTGVIVPGYTYADRDLSGLRGDYYQGSRFEILRHTQVDPRVKFSGDDTTRLNITPFLPAATPVSNGCSFRWSGQVRPQYAETYTFRTHSDGTVRLWVGRRLIIDTSGDHTRSEGAGQIKVEAGSWYPIVLELSTTASTAEVELFWSSASQRQETVPQGCLYSVLDETAELAPDGVWEGCGLMEVGQAVVGEGRPLTHEDYGIPLSDDYAHLFTAVVPASKVPLAAQRQALRDLIEAEKPAHTDFQLCLAEPRMRVGVQARLGIDSIVAGPPRTMALDRAELGRETYLGGDDHEHEFGTIGARSRIGVDTIVG
jgi:phage tail-like protein